MNKMRIAVLAAPRVSDPQTEQVPNSQARTAANLAEAINLESDSVHEAKVFHFVDPSESADDDLSMEDEEHSERIETRGSDHLSLMTAWRLARKSREFSDPFDVVCAGTLNTAALALSMRRTGLARRVVYIATHLVRPMLHWGIHIPEDVFWREAKCFEEVDALVFPSRLHVEQFHTYYPAPRPELGVHFIPNGTPCAGVGQVAKKPPIGQGINLFMASPIHPQSDYPTALYALRRIIAAHGKAVTLRISGTAKPDTPEFQPVGELGRVLEIATALDLLENIEFLGYVKRPRMPAQYQRAHVTLVTGVIESFGDIVSESLVEGTPVVATHVGAMPSLVRDRLFGHLVPPRSPALVAEKVLKIVDEMDMEGGMTLDERSEKIRGAFQPVEWEDTARKYITLFRELVSPKRTRRQRQRVRSDQVRQRLQRRRESKGYSIRTLEHKTGKPFESVRRLFDETATPILRWSTIQPVVEVLEFTDEEQDELHRILVGEDTTPPA